MSNKIKFNHNYIKLHGQKTAILRHVEFTSFLLLNPKAILYDTAYLKEVDSDIPGVKKTVEDFAKIHNGQLVRLEFFGNKGIPFTSYRKARRNTFNKYSRHMGEEYEIVVEEK